MVARYDVAGRLAEGAGALDEVCDYVRAAAMRGYLHPHLNRHPAQARDWYTCEDGLDLIALQQDYATLRSLADQVAEGVGAVAAQRTVVSGAWSGGGGEAAEGFLTRHLATAEVLRDRLFEAASAYRGLLERLWQAVDAKVRAALEIAGRPGSARADWLAAARAVAAGGASDQSLATVDDLVVPFVAGDVAGAWLTAMRAGTAAVQQAYADAAAALAAGIPVLFEVPGDLLPAPIAAAAPIPAATSPALPVAAPAPAQPLAAPALPQIPAGPPTADPGLGAALPAPPVAGMPELGLPEFGAPLDPGASADPGEPADPGDPEKPDAPEQSDAPDDVAAEEPAAEEPEDAFEAPDEPETDEPEIPEPEIPEPEPELEAEPELAAEPAPPEPEPLTTPCEIAADELPQVGE